jgi:hypothetical protein
MGSEVHGSEVQGSEVQRFRGSRFRGSGFRGSGGQKFKVDDLVKSQKNDFFRRVFSIWCLVISDSTT